MPKGKNQWGPILKDEEIMSSGEVKCYGTVIGVVLGVSAEIAQVGAAAVTVTYEEQDNPTIVTIREALHHKSVSKGIH